MTPLEVAGGYTILANEGVRAEPMYIRMSSTPVVNRSNAIRSARTGRSIRASLTW